MDTNYKTGLLVNIYTFLKLHVWPEHTSRRKEKYERLLQERLLKEIAEFIDQNKSTWLEGNILQDSRPMDTYKKFALKWIPADRWQDFVVFTQAVLTRDIIINSLHKNWK